MKIILLLFNIVLLVVLLTAPKRIHPLRLLTFMILMLYGIGIFRLIYLFPLATSFSLGAGFLAIVSIAILFRRRPIRFGITSTVHKIRPVNWQRNDARTKRKNILIQKGIYIPGTKRPARIW